MHGPRAGAQVLAEPPLPPRTKWTRRVPHPVLIGRTASLSQVLAEALDEPRAVVRLLGEMTEAAAREAQADFEEDQALAPPPPPPFVLSGHAASLTTY